MDKNPTPQKRIIDDPAYQKAKERVDEIKAFYTHLFVYLGVNIGLVLINIATSPNAFWFHWAILGWGIGLIVHALVVFGFESLFGPDWEERKIKEYMEKTKNDLQAPEK